MGVWRLWGVMVRVNGWFVAGKFRCKGFFRVWGLGGFGRFKELSGLGRK